ncbi:MAG: aminotransferase class I/II-fold pyridoxal phosphate-dependent enzyme [Candidatus Levyibacteriota bacterium]
MKTIAIGLSPNTETSDVLLAIKRICTPWSYKKGSATSLLEQWFRYYFHVSSAISFSSGRGALFAILHSLGIKNGDEVVLQAFTCVAVVEPILATGAKPLYVDIGYDLTLDVKKVESAITKKTKAIIAQHTFGIPAHMEKLRELAKKYNLFLIEDAAHVIGATYQNKKIGTFGIASIFSFGRDKAFSSVFGGMAITNDKKLGDALRVFQRKKETPGYFWIFQQLLHPIAFFFILPLYNIFSVGKALLVLLQRLHLLSFPVTKEEKNGVLPNIYIQKLPNALSALSYFQIRKVERYNKKREKIVQLYQDVCKKLGIQTVERATGPLLRFPIFVENPSQMKKFFKKRSIYLGNWYEHIIDPLGVDLTKIYYRRGQCLVAEECARKIVNLPTYPTIKEEDVIRVIDTLQAYVRG